VPWAWEVVYSHSRKYGKFDFCSCLFDYGFPLTIVRITDAFTSIMNDRGKFVIQFCASDSLCVHCCLQVIALLFSGCRGPLMGWLIGSFFLFVVMSLLRVTALVNVRGRKLSLLVGIFLVLNQYPQMDLFQIFALYPELAG
jgi:uncharacterized membrane protein